MKQKICTGAYGWRHRRWLNAFYPQDLPVEADEDWRLSYYSNEFNTVLVPVDYWQTGHGQASALIDSEHWLEQVHDEFQFFVECQSRMFEHISLSEFIASIKKLKPQLAGLVFLENKQAASNVEQDPFKTMIDAVDVDVFGASAVFGGSFSAKSKTVWRQHEPQFSNFAYLENDLSDLKSARMAIDRFAWSFEKLEPEITDATIIVDHAQLQASRLSEFRSLLEIMGY